MCDGWDVYQAGAGGEVLKKSHYKKALWIPQWSYLDISDASPPDTEAKRVMMADLEMFSQKLVVVLVL